MAKIWLANNCQHKVAFKTAVSKEIFEREITVLNKLSHNNIIKILEWFKRSYTMIFEYAEYGNLHRYLKNNILMSSSF